MMHQVIWSNRVSREQYFTVAYELPEVKANLLFLWIIIVQIILYVWLSPTLKNESPTQYILREILSYPRLKVHL